MASYLYQYPDSLDKTRIRLLTLKAGHQQEDIEIEIDVRNLEDKPQYEALSYEWGTSNKSHSVNVFDKQIRITPSLYAVLFQIRSSSKPLVLWTDAICINQDDIEEKNQQVPQMAKIFGNATRVLVWLGSEISESEAVLQMLSTLARLWISREVKRQKEGELIMLSWAEIDQDEAPLLAIGDRALWDTIYELMNRTYFERTWVVQEIALAKDPRVISGSLEISWAHFSWAAAYLGRSLHHLHENPTDAGLARINAIANLRSAHHKGQAIEIPETCLISQSLQATNPRDKVYGFLGLLSHGSSKFDPQNLLEVDYNLSEGTLFLRAAQCSIFASQDLRNCHSQAFPSRRLEATSSWAPDWCQRLDLAQTIALRPQNKIKGTISGNIWFESNIMHLNGYHIDQINYVSARLTCEAPLPDIQNIMFLLSQDQIPSHISENEALATRALEEIIRRLKQKSYMGSTTMYEAIWRTLIANTASFASASLTFERHFDAVVDSLRLRARGISWECTKACDQTKMDFHSQVRLLRDGEAQRLCQRIQAKDAGPYYRELVNTIMGRVFFVTQNGHIGFGSPGIQVGDNVSILKGGWTPFILRQSGNTFRMIGDAYVHGIKEENSWRGLSSKMQSIKIR